MFIIMKKNIKDGEVSILVTGDLCAGFDVENIILQGRGKEIIEDIQDVLSDKDLSIVNVEMSLTNNKNGIVKSGPCIRCEPECAGFVKDCGFDIACLANNHIGDYGPEAVMETIAYLNDLDIKTVGAGKNIEAANKILYIKQNNVTVAVLNYAEHEFGMAGKTKAGFAPIDIFNVIESIDEAKKSADVVIVILHGGNEENPVPSPRMVKWYRGFADAGANAVINIHPHCPQGFEMYNDVPIIYSLGNFVFQRLDENTDDMWDKGYMVKLAAAKDGKVTFDTIPYTFEGNKVVLMRGSKLKNFNEYLRCLSDLIINEDELRKYWLAWCKINAGEWTERFLENSHIENGSDDFYVLYMKNAFNCEAHNELFASYFEAFCEGKLDDLEPYITNIKKLQIGSII